eukprot:990829-Rhodomonas_salina.2
MSVPDTAKHIRARASCSVSTRHRIAHSTTLRYPSLPPSLPSQYQASHGQIAPYGIPIPDSLAYRTSHST